MVFEALNNIGASKKNQSIKGGFFLELSDDKTLHMIFFVVDFEAHRSLDASIFKYTIDFG
jgi:hypothetical protein